LLSPSLAKRFASLAPALGHQNHTASPSAKDIVRRARIAPDILRPSHPASNVRDDRDTSLLWKQDGAQIARLLKKRKKNIFSSGLNAAN
jgi:hypothetical protein